MKIKAKSNNFFKSSEEIVSMFLGLLIVVLVVSLVVNFFQRNRGKIDLPGISDRVKSSFVTDKKVETIKLVGENGNNNYKVKYGDSLWKICQNELGDGERWLEVAKINNLKNGSLLAVGQEIKLPERKVVMVKPEVKTASGNEYLVKKGDSLWKISVQAYGDGYQWSKIYRANQKTILNPNKIEVGMKLSL